MGSDATIIGASVRLGRKYSLSAGLLEITYQSGAKVILEGPCDYEVDSIAGGYLGLGKLTARVEHAKPQAANPESRDSSPAPRPQSPIPLLSVRTPTAIVTDQGTEFGVEVDRFGMTKSHVFQGKVELRSVGDKRNAIVLRENESARVEPNENRTPLIVRCTPLPDVFVRRMPGWVAVETFNTGVGVKEGDDDPHWQIVAVSNDPEFKPRPAVVTGTNVEPFLANDPARSQWISMADELPLLPERVTYTFRTTFELAKTDAATAVLKIGFIADNHVNAIRLNGVEVPLPRHGYYPPFTHPHQLVVSKGFVEGTNSLEVDVFNGSPSVLLRASPMALLVKLKCFALREPKRCSSPIHSTRQTPVPTPSPPKQQPRSSRHD